MLNMIKKLKFKIIIPFAVVVCLVGVAITYAANQDHTGTITNNFTAGEITTEIEEHPEVADGTIKKDPIVKNTGPNDALIRMRVNISPSNLKDYLEKNQYIDWNETDWYYNEEDQFWYYRYIVPSGGETNPLFTEIKGIVDKDNKVTDKFKEEVGSLEDFQINLYQEAVQTKVYDSNGQIANDGNGRIADVSNVKGDIYSQSNPNATNNANYIWELYEANK